jgi:hypothetical protein
MTSVFTLRGVLILAQQRLLFLFVFAEVRVFLFRPFLLLVAVFLLPIVKVSGRRA